MSTFEQSAREVDDRESFVRFLASMAADLKNNPKEWESRDLGSFLEAMGGWIEDMDGYYESQNLPQPRNINWAFMRDAFMAARIYE